MDLVLELKNRRRILSGIAAGLALIWIAAQAPGYQGMAVPTSVRPSKPVTTQLPLVHPDFRDVAAAAGLDMIHVSEIGRASCRERV